MTILTRIFTVQQFSNNNHLQKFIDIECVVHPMYLGMPWMNPDASMMMNTRTAMKRERLIPTTEQIIDHFTNLGIRRLENKPTNKTREIMSERI